MAAAAGPALSVASMGLGLVGAATKSSADSLAASSQAEGQEFQANQMDIAAKYGAVKADQTNTFLQQKLQGELANISAVRASAGVNASSPTGDAIAARVSGVADQQRIQTIQNIQAQTESDTAAAAFYRQSANNALLGGQLSSEGDWLGGIGGALGQGAGAVKSLNLG